MFEKISFSDKIGFLSPNMGIQNETCFLCFSYLGDVCFDAFGQFDAGLSEELGQLVGDVLVFIQSIQ